MIYPEAIYGASSNAKADFCRTMISETTHGKVFSGKFVKSNGELRTFNGRAYAEGSVIGSGRQLNQDMVPYIDNEVLIRELKAASNKLGRKLNKEMDMDIIESCRNKAWRSFKGERIVELKVNGEVIKFK